MWQCRMLKPGTLPCTRTMAYDPAGTPIVSLLLAVDGQESSGGSDKREDAPDGVGQVGMLDSRRRCFIHRADTALKNKHYEVMKVCRVQVSS